MGIDGMSGTAAWHPRLLNPWGWSWWKRTNWPLSGLEAWNLQDKIYSCHCWQPCTCIMWKGGPPWTLTSLSDNHGEWCAPPWAERWGHYLHLLPCNSCSFTYHYRLTCRSKCFWRLLAHLEFSLFLPCGWLLSLLSSLCLRFCLLPLLSSWSL